MRAQKPPRSGAENFFSTATGKPQHRYGEVLARIESRTRPGPYSALPKQGGRIGSSFLFASPKLHVRYACTATGHFRSACPLCLHCHETFRKCMSAMPCTATRHFGFEEPVRVGLCAWHASQESDQGPIQGQDWPEEDWPAQGSGQG